MFNKLEALAKDAKNAITSTAVLVGDLNGDGKVDQADAQIATEWAKKTANSVGDKAARLGKEALRTDMGKDAATGAAIGAAVAILNLSPKCGHQRIGETQSYPRRSALATNRPRWVTRRV